MSISEELARHTLNTKYQDGTLSSEVIELILKIEGRQIFMEEVDVASNPTSDALYVFITIIEISIAGNVYNKVELDDLFMRVPAEYKVNAICLGDMDTYYPQATDSKFPENFGIQRELDKGGSGELFMGFDGSLWVDDKEGGLHLAARNFGDFMLIRPKTHFQKKYLMSF